MVLLAEQMVALSAYRETELAVQVLARVLAPELVVGILDPETEPTAWESAAAEQVS